LNLILDKMEIEITKKEKVAVAFLQVSANVRYWEDALVNGIDDNEGGLIPFRKGDAWVPKIDLETGTILGWPKDTSASIHYKICDNGTYALQDRDGKTIYERDGYVPNILCPKENGYGDYIIMDIDENGVIQNWKSNLSDFVEEED